MFLEYLKFMKGQGTGKAVNYTEFLDLRKYAKNRAEGTIVRRSSDSRSDYQKALRDDFDSFMDYLKYMKGQGSGRSSAASASGVLAGRGRGQPAPGAARQREVDSGVLPPVAAADLASTSGQVPKLGALAPPRPLLGHGWSSWLLLGLCLTTPLAVMLAHQVVQTVVREAEMAMDVPFLPLEADE